MSALSPEVRELIDQGIAMLDHHPMAREVLEYAYRYGVLDGQLKMASRAEAVLKDAFIS